MRKLRKRALGREFTVTWTFPQVITSAVSVIAIILSVTTFVIARVDVRREVTRQERQDLLRIDQLLNSSFELLYGRDGYSKTKNQMKLSDAEIAIEQALKIYADHPRTIEYEGHIFEAHGNKKEASKRYNKAISLDPTRARPHHLLGLLSEGDEAEQAFKKAIDLDGENSRYPYDLGTLYVSLGRLPEAERCFRRAIEIRPKYADAHNDLGRLLEKQGHHEAARKEYKQAIAADPNYVGAMVNLGAMLMKDSGSEEDGIAWLEHATKQDPSNNHPVRMLAAIYADRKEPDRALRYAKQAMDIDPTLRFEEHFRELIKAMQDLLDTEGSVEQDY